MFKNNRNYQIRQQFTKLYQRFGMKLKYNVEELCEIFQHLEEHDLIMRDFIGSGAEGPVFAVMDRDTEIAVKVVSTREAQRVDNQLKIMEKFQNQPYILQFIGAFYSEDRKYFFYLTEKLDCDLQKIFSDMKINNRQFTYNEIIDFAVQMATALNTLKSKQVIHSDIKPANILYDKANNCFKLSDYGLSKFIIPKLQQSTLATESIYGWTHKYAAPEILQQAGNYSCKIDIYSLGLVLLEMITGELPSYEIMKIATGMVNASSYLINNKKYQPLNEVILSMLQLDQWSRISSANLLQQLKQIQKNQLSNSSYPFQQMSIGQNEFQKMRQTNSSSHFRIKTRKIKQDELEDHQNAYNMKPNKNLELNQQQHNYQPFRTQQFPAQQQLPPQKQQYQQQYENYNQNPFAQQQYPFVSPSNYPYQQPQQQTQQYYPPNRQLKIHQQQPHYSGNQYQCQPRYVPPQQPFQIIAYQQQTTYSSNGFFFQQRQIRFQY